MISFQDHRYLPIEKEESVDIAPVARGQFKAALEKQRILTDVETFGPPDYCAGEALKGAWEAKKECFFFQFSALDVQEFPYLSFRLSQVHGDTLNLVDRKKDFHVVVSDAEGHAAKAKLSDYLGGLQYPDLSGSLPPDDICNRKQIMRGFRIPQKDFAGVDFSKICSVRFVFDRPGNKAYDNKSGTIKVKDLEFSH